MSKKHLHICYSSDNNIAEHLAVSIYSLLYNLDQDYFANIYIIDGGISEKNKRLINQIGKKSGKGKILYLKISQNKYKKLPIGISSSAMYYRLEIPSILKQLKTIVYLDVDVIVDSSIHEIFSYNIENYGIGAVKDPIAYHQFKSWNIPETIGYFNSGVMLVNLEYFRVNKISSKVLKYIESKYKQDKREIFDMGGLNGILYNAWLPIPPKFNVLDIFGYIKTKDVFTKSDLKGARTNPCIIHYAGVNPWKPYKFHFLKSKYGYYRSLAGLPTNNCQETFIYKQMKCIKHIIMIFLRGRMSLKTQEKTIKIAKTIGFSI